MCGIISFINCGNKNSLIKALSSISHRGPDDEGVEWFDEINWGLGHRRLSIIDLSKTGHQPMCNNNKRFWIAYNGEIYNYKEIKNELKAKGINFKSTSDTEVILQAYLEWGETCLDKFNGMFAFVIFDIISKTVFAARDRIGIKPLYYYQESEKIILASEIKAILTSGIYNKEPDYAAIHTPIHYQVSPFTGFKNIKKLLPGHCLTFKDHKFEIRRYWGINPHEDYNKNDRDAENKLNKLLYDSVKLQMVSDVPVGILLSGGLDSSIIAALMQKHTNEQVNSFTIKFKDKDLKLQGNVDDSYYAKIVADLFKFNHHEIIVEPDIVDLLPKIIWHLDEPIADPSSINTYLISKAARENGIIVLLNGIGGDEVFSGYRAHLACLKADTYQKIIPEFLQTSIRKIVELLPESSDKRNYKKIRWLKRFVEFGSLPPFERMLASKNSSLTSTNFSKYFISPDINYELSIQYQKEQELFQSNNCSYLTKLCLSDSTFYLPDHNLTYSDKASMAASVEGRPPLTDHRIIEFMFSLPPRFKIMNNIQKYLLKKVSEKYLPNNIINRTKAPFSAPMRGWLKHELSGMVSDILSEGSLKKRGIYNPEFVNKLIKDNNNGLKDNSQLIWRLLTNEIWFRTFFN